MTALVEPPIAASTRIAFSKLDRVSTCDGRRSSATIPTIRRPARCARRSRRLSAAGSAAFSGNAMPSASTIEAMVDAVPIVLHEPLLRVMHDSAARKSASDRVPARTSSLSRHTSVPEPMARPS